MTDSLLLATLLFIASIFTLVSASIFAAISSFDPIFFASLSLKATSLSALYFSISVWASWEFSESEVEPDPLPQGTDSQEAEILDNNPSSELVNSQMNHWKKKMRTASLGENTQSDLMAARPPDIRTATNTA